MKLKRIHQLRKHICKHSVTFDISKITNEMSTAEVRNLFPRLMGECPLKCGYTGIAYASYEHYIYGDW